MTTLKPFKTHLDERRRSEKISGQPKEILTGHQAALDYFQGKELTQYGVTMTDIPKVGVNPKSHYDTPLGIYFYPAKYYVDIISGGLELPFQHSAKYINILKIKTRKTRILYLENLTQLYVHNLLESLKLIYPDDQKTIDSLYSEASMEAKFKTPAGKFWYVLYRASKNLNTSAIQSTKSSVVWNNILRKLGYDCVIDNGTGIIHTSEKNQGFFTNASSDVVANVKRFDNNLETRPVALLIKTLKNTSISDDDKIEYMDSYVDKLGNFGYPLSSVSYNHYQAEKPNVYYINKKAINKFSDELKVNFFTNISGQTAPIKFVQDLENPSDYVLKGIIEANYRMIHYMKDPSAKIQMMAVQNDLKAMQYIKNPAPEVIEYFKNETKNSEFI